MPCSVFVCDVVKPKSWSTVCLWRTCAWHRGGTTRLRRDVWAQNPSTSKTGAFFVEHERTSGKQATLPLWLQETPGNMQRSQSLERNTTINEFKLVSRQPSALKYEKKHYYNPTHRCRVGLVYYFHNPCGFR